MSTYYAGSPQDRTLRVGRLVVKNGLTLPQTATSTLFTVANGRVLVTSLVGTVSTVIGGAVTVALGVTPTTTGTPANTAIGTAGTITSFPVGAQIVPPATMGSAVSVLAATAAIPAVISQSSWMLVSPGAITWTTAANQTGALSWALTYVMYDEGASVS